MDYLPVITIDLVESCNGLLASNGHCFCQILALDYLPAIAESCNGLLASNGHCYCQILAMDYWAVIPFAKKIHGLLASNRQ